MCIDHPEVQALIADNSQADYGPGFVRDEDLSRTDLLRNESYYLLHVQQNAMNEENLLRFVKMISYPQ